MNQTHILKRLYDGKIDIDEAQSLLEPSPLEEVDTRLLKRARFIKFRIRVPNESRGVNLLLRCLFALPIPLALVRVLLRTAGKRGLRKKMPEDLELETLLKLLKYSKHTKIAIISDDAKVLIKII